MDMVKAEEKRLKCEEIEVFYSLENRWNLTVFHKFHRLSWPPANVCCRDCPSPPTSTVPTSSGYRPKSLSSIWASSFCIWTGKQWSNSNRERTAPGAEWHRVRAVPHNRRKRSAPGPNSSTFWYQTQTYSLNYQCFFWISYSIIISILAKLTLFNI